MSFKRVNSKKNSKLYQALVKYCEITTLQDKDI